MKRLFLVFLLFLGVAAVNAEFVGDFEVPSAEIEGLLYVPVGNISIDTDRSYTVIDAKVENTGFETIFISLPLDWEPDLADYSAKTEPVITERTKLHKKYGARGDKFSFNSNFFVFFQPAGFAVSRGNPLSKFAPTKENPTVKQEYIGWYIRPNERLVFHIRLLPKEGKAKEAIESGGIIDPRSLEQNRSDISVIEWNEEFVLYPDTDTPDGFLMAPISVEGATMVEAFPGPIANLSAFTGGFQFNYLELETLKQPPQTTAPAKEVEELNPPAWDEWFSASGIFGLTPNSLATLKTEPIDIPEVVKQEPDEEEEIEESEPVFIPVWLVNDNVNFIRYRYEWERGEVIEGVNVNRFKKQQATLTELYGETGATVSTVTSKASSEIKLDITTVPAWYGWF